MRIFMKKLIASMVFILLLAAQAYADQYMLVMSKNDQVCQHMYEVYFWDMRKHGKIVFENHEEYNWLKWDEDISLYRSKKYNTPAYDGWNTGKIASFDINNDGTKETVLFERRSLSNALHDLLSFFPISYYQKFKKKLYREDLPKDFPSFPPRSYALKELPVQIIVDNFGIKEERRITLGTWSFVRPLRIGTEYFLSIFGSRYQGDPYPPIELSNIISISRYNPDNHIEDICYFVRATLWEHGTYPWLNKKEGDQ